MTRLPSTELVRWSARVFGDDVAQRVFAPLVADWAHELRKGRSRHARLRAWVNGATAFAFCTAAVGLSMARPQRRDWPAFGRGLLTSAAFLVAGCVTLFLPFSAWWANRGWTFVPLAFALLPTMITLSLPFALLPGALALGSPAAGRGTWRARIALATTVLLVTCALWTAQASVIPATTSRFERVLRVSSPTTPEALNAPVLRLAGLATIAKWGSSSVNESHRRAATTFVWPTALAVLGWRIGRHRRKGGAVAATGWWLAAVAVGLAFQPVATPFNSLHPMTWWQTPEFSAAAVWLAMAVAFRPGPASPPAI